MSRIIIRWLVLPLNCFFLVLSILHAWPMFSSQPYKDYQTTHLGYYLCILWRVRKKVPLLSVNKSWQVSFPGVVPLYLHCCAGAEWSRALPIQNTIWWDAVRVPNAGRCPEGWGTHTACLFRAQLVCCVDGPQGTMAHPSVCTYPAYFSSSAWLHVRRII